MVETSWNLGPEHVVLTYSAQAEDFRMAPSIPFCMLPLIPCPAATIVRNWFCDLADEADTTEFISAKGLARTNGEDPAITESVGKGPNRCTC